MALLNVNMIFTIGTLDVVVILHKSNFLSVWTIVVIIYMGAEITRNVHRMSRINRNRCLNTAAILNSGMEMI